MKARLSAFPLIVLLAVVGGYFACEGDARAQLPPNDPSTPAITLTASDPNATEAGDPGAFRLFRSGPTNLALTVYWLITGSATAGEDYNYLPFFVNIPAGVREVIVRVLPAEDTVSEGPETVAAWLVNTPGVPAPLPYRVGSPSNAVVTIQDNDPKPNHPPTVSLTMPTNGASFTYPATIQIAASAHDPDDFDYVDRVEFFDGTNSLGTRTNCLPCASPTNPFLVFASLPPGEHLLTAKATDSHGASSVSDPVVIRVPLPLPSVVTIQATDPNAPEPGVLTVLDPGVFTITRTGGTNFALPVHYSIHGTASNGLDYVAISNQVVIPIGKTAATVSIWPLGDNLVEGTETVVLRLEDVACIAIFPPPPECYVVGAPREAVVYVADFNHATNQSPKVKLTKPLDGQTFNSGANVPLRAEALDVDGYVDHIEFYADEHKIGEETRYYLTPPPPGQVAVFEFAWTNPPPGRHVLTARASDDDGAFGSSPPVAIWIAQSNALPPVVTISAPDPIASEGPWWANWSNAPAGGSGGTNAAAFVIRRSGPTNDALTVQYRIGGTASNGVDYVTLPYAMTIPAGRRAVEFKLIPRDDLLPEPLESVVLGLRVPAEVTSNVPPYVVGFPARAEAVIVDNDAPRPHTGPLTDHSFHITKPGANGTWWRIECSRDLLNWTVLGTNQVTDGALHFVDPDADEETRGYYRAVPSEAPVD